MPNFDCGGDGCGDTVMCRSCRPAPGDLHLSKSDVRDLLDALDFVVHTCQQASTKPWTRVDRVKRLRAKIAKLY